MSLEQFNVIQENKDALHLCFFWKRSWLFFKLIYWLCCKEIKFDQKSMTVKYRDFWKEISWFPQQLACFLRNSRILCKNSMQFSMTYSKIITYLFAVWYMSWGKQTIFTSDANRRDVYCHRHPHSPKRNVTGLYIKIRLRQSCYFALRPNISRHWYVFRMAMYVSMSAYINHPNPGTPHDTTTRHYAMP